MNFDESLLTAYLDDELTPRERQLVEQQLAAHREHRETLRELSELQQRLVSLPRETFSTDVVAEVQQRIRRRQGIRHQQGIRHPKAAGRAETPPGERDQPLPELPLPATPGKRPGWHLWLPLALAASGLAMLSLASLRQPEEVAVRALPNEGGANEERASEERASEERANAARPPASEKSAASRTIASEGIDAAAAPKSAAPAPAAPPSAAQTSEAPRLAEAFSMQRDSARSQGSRPAPRSRELFYAESQTAANSLPAGTRLFRLSEVAGATRLEALDGSLGATADGALAGPAEGNAVVPADRSEERFARFAGAPRIAYQVPPEEIGSILQWLAAREDDEARSLPAQTKQPSPAGERPVAVLVAVPAEQMPSLLESIGRRIRESQGTPTSYPRGFAAPAELARSAATETAEAVIVLLPTEPQP